MNAAPGRYAFPALITANLSLALGPWMVRLADVGPVAAGFWRLALAVPFLAILAWRQNAARPLPGWALIGTLALIKWLDLSLNNVSLMGITLAVGAKTDNLHGTPVTVTGRGEPERIEHVLSIVGSSAVRSKSHINTRSQILLDRRQAAANAQVAGRIMHCGNATAGE